MCTQFADTRTKPEETKVTFGACGSEISQGACGLSVDWALALSENSETHLARLRSYWMSSKSRGSNISDFATHFISARSYVSGCPQKLGVLAGGRTNSPTPVESVSDEMKRMLFILPSRVPETLEASGLKENAYVAGDCRLLLRILIILLYLGEISVFHSVHC